MGRRWPWQKTVLDSEGAHARVAAEENLKRAREQRPVVELVAASLRGHREANHFADKIEGLIRGRSQ